MLIVTPDILNIKPQGTILATWITSYKHYILSVIYGYKPGHVFNGQYAPQFQIYFMNVIINIPNIHCQSRLSIEHSLYTKGFTNRFKEAQLVVTVAANLWCAVCLEK